MAAARGSSEPGRWWSVTITSIPSRPAASTPSTLAIPLSTVMRSSGVDPCARERRMQGCAHEVVVQGEGNRGGGDLGHQLCIGGKGLAQPPEIAEVRTRGLDLQEPILSGKVQREHPDPA